MAFMGFAVDSLFSDRLLVLRQEYLEFQETNLRITGEIIHDRHIVDRLKERIDLIERRLEIS